MNLLWLFFAFVVGYFICWLRKPMPIEVSLESTSPPATPHLEPLGADELYDAYREATGGVSAVSGAPLPEFEACPEGARKGWEAVAERANGRLDDNWLLRRIDAYDDLIVEIRSRCEDMNAADFAGCLRELRQVLAERDRLAFIAAGANL